MGITKKQKDVYDFILNYTETHGVSPTQKEIRDQFELKSFGSVQRYIKYLTEAGYLNSDWNARRGLKPTSVKPADSYSQNNPYSIEIPLLGDVAAGKPIEAIEQAHETLSVPTSLLGRSGRHFALKVRGDSMIDEGIFEEDLIICRFQEDATQGQIIVAMVDGEATVKKYYRKKASIELHPANSRLRPIIVSEEQDFKIAGVLVGLLRSYA